MLGDNDHQGQRIGSSDDDMPAKLSSFGSRILHSQRFAIACVVCTIVVVVIAAFWPESLFSVATYPLMLFTPCIIWIQAKDRFSSFTFNRAIIVGLVLRVFLASWTAQRYDAYVFALDGLLFVKGYPVLYPYSTANPGFPTVLKWLYPPIFLYWCGFVVLLFIKLHLFTVPLNISLLWDQAIVTGNIYEAYWSFLPPSFPAMIYMFKLPSILADIGIAFVLLRLLGGGDDAKNNIVSKWIFNPFIIFITSIWGMFDILPAFVSLLAVLFFLRKRYMLSGFLLAIGFGLKMYPVFLFFPLAVVAFYSGDSSLKDRILGVTRLLMGAIIGGILSILPYLFYENPVTSFLYLLGARAISGGGSSFSAHGHSLQEISQLIAQVLLPTNFLLPLTYFLILFVPLYLLILLLARRTSNSLVPLSTLLCITIIALFLCNSSVTTQNFLWILPFLFICSYSQKSWGGYTWISRLVLLGAFFGYSVLYFVSPLITTAYLYVFPFQYEGYRVGATQFIQAPIILIIIISLLLASLLIAQLKPSPDIKIKTILSQKRLDRAIPIVLIGLIALSPIIISGMSQFLYDITNASSLAIGISTAVFLIIYGGFLLGVATRIGLVPELRTMKERLRLS